MAALDVGSNTVRLLVARPNDADLEPVYEDSRFVRLGYGVDASGHLDPDRKREGLVAIRELVEAAHACGATAIRAIGTSAVRDAADGREFAAQVESDVGVPLEILSGDEEARLTFLGATTLLDISDGALVADIGGGSSEVIAADLTGILWARSFKIGSGRLTDRFVTHDPPDPAERHNVSTYVLTCLGHVDKHRFELAIFTGGTASTVASLASGVRAITTKVPLDAIHHVERLAYSATSQQLTEKYGLRSGRAQIFPAGTTILRTIAEWSEATSILVTRHGIREGVVLDALASLT